MNNLPLLFSGIMILIFISAVTPWQLFQSLCPYIGAQSPQCAFLQQQLQQQQIPLSQQQIPPQSTTSPFTSPQLGLPPTTSTPTTPTAPTP